MRWNLNDRVRGMSDYSLNAQRVDVVANNDSGWKLTHRLRGEAEEEAAGGLHPGPRTRGCMRPPSLLPVTSLCCLVVPYRGRAAGVQTLSGGIPGA